LAEMCGKRTGKRMGWVSRFPTKSMHAAAIGPLWLTHKQLDK